jgi:hypothetical protein
MTWPSVISFGDLISACPLQCQKNLLEEFHRDMLASGDLVALQCRRAVNQGELDESSKRVFAFL